MTLSLDVRSDDVEREDVSYGREANREDDVAEEMSEDEIRGSTEQGNRCGFRQRYTRNWAEQPRSEPHARPVDTPFHDGIEYDHCHEEPEFAHSIEKVREDDEEHESGSTGRQYRNERSEGEAGGNLTRRIILSQRSLDPVPNSPPVPP